MTDKAEVLNRILTFAAVLVFAIAIPAFAQDNSTAGESMHRAGQATEQAGSSAWTATKDAAHGTATAVRDTKITTEVKTSLHKAGLTKDAEIHVRTTAGMVELTGVVPSSGTAMRAVQVARETDGVKGVTNDLTVAGAKMPN